MKISGRLKDIEIDIETQKPIMLVEVNEKQELLSNADELYQCESLDIEIKKHREKRSLSANAYAWVLMDKLAEVLRIPKEKVYQNIVRNIGGNSTFVSVSNEAVDKLIQEWGRNGLGWSGEVVTEGEEMSEVILYYGSSTYDTKQMSRLIELVIQECEEQGIATETLERAAYMEGLLSA